MSNNNRNNGPVLIIVDIQPDFMPGGSLHTGAIDELHVAALLLGAVLDQEQSDREMAAAAVLDHMRFIDSVDEVLARHGDEVDTFYPDSDVLLAENADIISLARALEEGVLKPSDLGAFTAANDVVVDTGVEDITMSPLFLLSHALREGLSGKDVSEAIAIGVEPDFIIALLGSQGPVGTSELLREGNAHARGGVSTAAQ